MNTNRLSRAAKAAGWSKSQRHILLVGINWLRLAAHPKYAAEHHRSYRVLLHGGGLSFLRNTKLRTLLIGADAAAPTQIFTEIEKYFVIAQEDL